MPDRTGEPRPGRDEPQDVDQDQSHLPTPTELRAIAIRNCHLCDPDGYRHTTVCDHQDHTGPAQRGMNTIRAQMGWNTTPTTTPPPNNNLHPQP